MCEDVLSDGVQVAGVRDVADVLRHSLDHHVTRREHKLVGAHLYLGGVGHRLNHTIHTDNNHVVPKSPTLFIYLE